MGVSHPAELQRGNVEFQRRCDIAHPFEDAIVFVFARAVISLRNLKSNFSKC